MARWHGVTTQWDTLKWTDVQEGQDLPTVQYGPIRWIDMVRGAAGTRDIYPVHSDRDFAQKEAGARDAFLNTSYYSGLLGRYANWWGGPESFMRRLYFNMRANNCPGDLLTFRGKVLRKYEKDGMKLVDLEVAIDNQLGPNTVPAQITLELL